MTEPERPINPPEDAEREAAWKAAEEEFDRIWPWQEAVRLMPYMNCLSLARILENDIEPGTMDRYLDMVRARVRENWIRREVDGD